MFEHNASSKPADAGWAAHEFALAPLPDQRLVSRLITLASDFALQPTASIPQACGSWAKTKAAYRFFDHDGIRPEDLLAAHVQATIQRAAAHPFVLCVQDTTSLNYSTHPQTKGRGPSGNNRDKTIGLFLHSTLARTPKGKPLGLLQAQSWTRSTATFLFPRAQPYAARPEGKSEVEGQLHRLPGPGPAVCGHHAGQRGRPRGRSLRSVRCGPATGGRGGPAAGAFVGARAA